MKEITNDVRVIIEPEDGTVPVAMLMRAATSTLTVKQFSLTHPVFLQALVEAQARGVEVQVMLNPHRSSGSRANDEAFEFLKNGGVAVAWTNPQFAVTHEKSMVVDGRLALVATFNFCEKYFSQTRDYGLVITDADEVAQVAACFLADWERRNFTPSEQSALLWSNRNSRRVMSAFIDETQERLDIQHPKFVDAVILDRIAAAQERGVEVRLLCGGKHGISDYDLLDTFSSLRLLRRCGVRVHKQRGLRVHAKLLIADRRRALVGSMNIDRSAFDLRRELGVVVSAHQAVHRLVKVFDADWESSSHYHIPDPMSTVQDHNEDDFPVDPEMAHE